MQLTAVSLAFFCQDRNLPTITFCYEELRQLYSKCSVQTWIRNKSILKACNTEMILMKERKHHSAYEKKGTFENENPVQPSIQTDGVTNPQSELQLSLVIIQYLLYNSKSSRILHPLTSPAKLKKLLLVNHRQRSQIETQASYRSLFMSAIKPVLNQN